MGVHAESQGYLLSIIYSCKLKMKGSAVGRLLLKSKSALKAVSTHSNAWEEAGVGQTSLSEEPMSEVIAEEKEKKVKEHIKALRIVTAG